MLLGRYPNNWRSNDVLLHALLGVSVIRGKGESHLVNRTLCKEDNTMLNQKQDEEQFSGLTLIPSELGRLWEGISVECCKTKTKGKSKEYNQEEEQNRLSALSVRKRKWPRLRLDLVFNVADLSMVCVSVLHQSYCEVRQNQSKVAFSWKSPYYATLCLLYLMPK